MRFAVQLSVDHPEKAVRSIETAHSRAIERAQLDLTENISEELYVCDVARRVGLSPSHLVHLFTRLIGMPPRRYRMHVRVEHARRMLLDGLSATEVAFACGFCDQSHLNRWFKRVVGSTPGQYAKGSHPRLTHVQAEERQPR